MSSKQLSMKNQAAVDEHNTQSKFLQFPDHILLCIFQYLDTVSIVNISKVNRRLYQLSCDKTLTKLFDLRRCPLHLKQLWSLSYKKLSSNTVSVHIRGASKSTQTMENLSVAYLQDLNKRCPSLSYLSLQSFDLREIPLNSLTNKLKYLSLQNSMLSMGWFDSLKMNFSFPKLTYLDLKSCSKVSNIDLESLSYLKNINTLILSNCFRISARGIPPITANMNKLRHVDFSGCPAVNNVVLYYLSKLPLEHIGLRFCHLITSHGINQLFSCNIGKTLKFLDVYSCHEITDEALDVIITNSFYLHTLDVGGCNKLSLAKVEEARKELKNCEVRFQRVNPHISQQCDPVDHQVCSMMHNGTLPHA